MGCIAFYASLALLEYFGVLSSEIQINLPAFLEVFGEFGKLIL